METAETLKYKGVTIEINYDDDPALNPRHDDNFSTIVDRTTKYGLSDEGPLLDKSELVEGRDAVLPLYIYDHSGITISTSPFGCQWDSGLIGYVYATEETMKKEFGVEELTIEHRKQAMRIMRAEVEIYDKYLRGEVYWFSYDTGKIEDSCGGYYSIEDAIADAKSSIDSSLNHRKKEHFTRMKNWIKSKVNINYRTPMRLI